MKGIWTREGRDQGGDHGSLTTVVLIAVKNKNSPQRKDRE